MRWRSTSLRVWALVGVVVVTLVVLAVVRGGAAPQLATAEVTRGEFVDIVEIRGQIRPLKSIVVTAPMQAGELQILKLVANGTAVKAGDVVVEFDGSTLLRTVQEKQSELRQAGDELDQAKAQASITTEQDRTNLLHSRYDVDRAKLGLADEEIVSRIEAQNAQLTLADAEQRLREAEVKDGANQQATRTGFVAQNSKIAKVRADLEKAERSLAALQVKAPADGVVSIMPNYRASSGMATPQEYRTGDRAWPGAQILELPDLSSVHLAARLDESDRGQLLMGQLATIRVDAIPDHEYQADVADISVLARVDFSSWPPVKNFDLNLTIRDADTRLRPGMSAAARIAVGRTADMFLVPAEALFVVDGQPVIYRLERRAFAAVPVAVVKRNREQAAITGATRAGDRVALTKPDLSLVKAAK